MEIFHRIETSVIFQDRMSRFNSEILGEDKNQLLNCNEVEYIQYIVSKYTIEPLEFDWENKCVFGYPAGIDIDDAGEPRPVQDQVITYHIPYRGNSNLLNLKPSIRTKQWEIISIEHDIYENEISFNIRVLNDDSEEAQKEAIEKKFNNIMENIQTKLANVIKDIKNYNNSLESRISKAVRFRKAELLKQSNLLTSLGVPIRKSSDVPDTFAIPISRKKVTIKTPIAPDTAFKPEPTLDPSTYKEILKICHQFGVEMERHPSIYTDRGEETLRDFFLMLLSPHFQSVTGETFNKSGKTDILIRHEGANVFIAECKFWDGIKSHHNAIDQLLGYLTFRDSKSAILCFIKNKELTPVLEQIENETSKHSCFVKSYGKIAESYFRFNFHLKDDSTRGVEVAVLCFHFPE